MSSLLILNTPAVNVVFVRCRIFIGPHKSFSLDVFLHFYFNNKLDVIIDI